MCLGEVLILVLERWCVFFVTFSPSSLLISPSESDGERGPMLSRLFLSQDDLLRAVCVKCQRSIHSANSFVWFAARNQCGR
jgi:hypothetical protein